MELYNAFDEYTQGEVNPGKYFVLNFNKPPSTYASSTSTDKHFSEVVEIAEKYFKDNNIEIKGSYEAISVIKKKTFNRSVDFEDEDSMFDIEILTDVPEVIRKTYLLDKEVIFIGKDGNSVNIVVNYSGIINPIYIELVKNIKDLCRKSFTNTGKLYTLTHKMSSLSIKSSIISEKIANINENYNDVLIEQFKNVEKHLAEDKSGLTLLYGNPGTGKSSYINYLIQNINKKFIFIPNYITDQLDSPSFIEVLFENPGSVLIIEDAEKVLQSRDKHGNNLISTILNLSDGLLGDCLNLQLICTMNAKLTDIDDAIKRKGRLNAMVHFDKLDLEKTKVLFKKLEYKDIPKGEMTLADIYNYEENPGEYKDKPVKIGFLK